MSITSDRVREIFKGLENGDGTAFFEHVADDVDWIVMGTHPLAAHYRSKKAFREGTFAKLGQVLQNGAQLHVEDLIVKDDEAVVELHSLATAKNGMRFDNRYCWVVYFHRYFDSPIFFPLAARGLAWVQYDPTLSDLRVPL